MQYSRSVPPFIQSLSSVPPMQRLKGIEMNCGCERTSWPLFKALKPYSRYEHSVGTALIVWSFTHDVKQSTAALFHDISTPCFAHSIDFLLGDYSNQEATEGKTRQIIEESGEVLELLKQYNLTVDQVCDYHIYPAADSPAPHLCADRFEYSLRNMVNYGICTPEVPQRLYGDIVLIENEKGFEEFAFRSAACAHTFSMNAIRCSHVYACETDRYTMQCLSELVARAIDKGLFTFDELFEKTEDVIVGRIENDAVLGKEWKAFCRMHGTVSSVELPEPFTPGNPGPWRKLPVKKRIIDPLLQGQGRASKLFSDFREEMDIFLNESQDVWIRDAI